MDRLSENLWLHRFPLRILGCTMGRNVTIVRLSSGQLVIHSTAPFSEKDVAAIEKLGTPAWLLDSTLIHDTFAEAGHRSFPDVPFLAPPGFPASFETQPLDPPPAQWQEELDVFPLDGVPKLHEHLLYHRPSATLLAADLLFNMEGAGPWTRGFLRLTAGLEPRPSMSRYFRFLIKDRDAFRASLQPVRALDIKRIVVAHGNPIVNDAQGTLERILAKHGF